MSIPDATLANTRRSLLTRLKNWDDRQGWQRFFDTYWRLLFSVARRMGLNDADAEDVVQETVLMVAKQMPDFRYDPARGSFKGWLMLIARRRVIAHLRRRGRQPQAVAPETARTGRTAAIERIADPDASQLDQLWDEEWNRHLFDAALARVSQRADPRHLQVFDCYVVKGWKVEDIARSLKVSTALIYTVKHRIAALIKEEVDRLAREMV